jgi:hypothetical protein
MDQKVDKNAGSAKAIGSRIFQDYQYYIKKPEIKVAKWGTPNINISVVPDC